MRTSFQLQRLHTYSAIGIANKKDDVHRQNIQQGRAVNEQDRTTHAMDRMRQVEVEQTL
jgi:hypothetical protein